MKQGVYHASSHSCRGRVDRCRVGGHLSALTVQRVGMRFTQRGFTLIELLLVLAIVVVLAVGASIAFSRTEASAQARALASMLTMVRWRAVLHGAPITVRPADHAAVWIVEGTYACDAEAVPGARRLELEVASVSSVWPAHAVAFGPDGRPRSCWGGGVGSATIDIADRRGERAVVIVSALGRVRWERR